MNRREVINKLTLLSGGVLLTSSGLLQSCRSPVVKRYELTGADVPLLDEIGDIIIPPTSTSPGAKAAKIGTYILVMVNECYDEKQRLAFINGLNNFDQLCFTKFNKDFKNIGTVQKTEFLIGLQHEANQKGDPHYFNMLKSLTISGYFSSEIGATKARRYEAIPGSYHGCISYQPGDRVWATS